jgi:hypothetical protein
MAKVLLAAIVTSIAVSPTVAGWALRATIAAPLHWLGLVDLDTAIRCVQWSAF